MSTPAGMSQAPTIDAGREPAAAAVRAWLDDVLRPRLCLVTGAPGTGKSHLTAWTALTDAETGRTVHSMIGARGLTVHALAWALAEQLSVAGGSPDAVVAGIAADERRATVVIGELDESGAGCDGSAAPAIITGLLEPLLALPHIRLLVEGRPECLAAFTAPAEVIHLDAPELTDPAGFTGWLRRRHPDTAAAEALYPNVGLAELALRATATDDVPARWLDTVPPDAVPALDVLASVYAPIDGETWGALTAALTGDAGRARTSVGLAAPFADSADDAFQLACRPLREAIVRRRTPETRARIGNAIGRTLYELVPKDTAGAPRWDRAPRYTTVHLLRHAAVTGVADGLVADTAQLVHADPRTATAVLDSVDGDAAARYRPVWHAAGPGLVRTPAAAERAALLRLSALLRHDRPLADRFAPYAAWEPGWYNVRGNDWTGPVSALAQRGGVLLVATADGTLQTLDSATGAPVGRIAGGTPDIWGLVWCTDGSVLHLDAHGAVRADGAPGAESRADRLSGLLNQNASTELTAAAARDTLVRHPGLTALGAAPDLSGVVTGDASGNVHAADRSRHLHDGPVTAITTMRGRTGRLAVISGGADGAVRIWAVDEEPAGEPLVQWNTGVTAVAYASRTMAAAWTDGQIWTWDMDADEERQLNLGLTVNALAVLPGGLLAVAGPHGTVTVPVGRGAP